MRYLFLNQFFWPDNAPTGELLGHVAGELVRRGHKVTVIAANAAYGTTAVAEKPQGVHIVRVPVAGFSRVRGGRMLSWMSFLAAAAIRAAFLRRHDVVVALTTPPGLSLPAVLLAGIWRAKAWIWEMDVYPDVATSIGEAKPDALWVRVLSAFLLWSRRRSDGIIALGPCMRSRLASHGIEPEQIVIAENWADDSALPAMPMPARGPLRILYSGNLGLAHEVDTVFEAINILRDDTRVQFRFAGGGAARSKLEQLCRGMDIRNISFEPYCASERLAESIGSADISLVTLRSECVGTVVPSKVYSAFAVGRPVLFVGPADSTSAATIRTHGCGWTVQPGASGELVDLLLRLAGDRKQVEGAALNSRRLFESRYTREHGARRVADILEGAAATVHLPCHPKSGFANSD